MDRIPIIHPTVQTYLDQTDMSILTKNHTRPVNVLFPKVFAQNINNMKMLLDDEMIDYKIYFANKASKADVFVQTAKENWIWLDVSSFQELQDALTMWYNPEDILANGPKDILFLKLCLENNIMISVDSIGEIKKIIDFDIKSTSNIMLRICPPKDIAHSRFGILSEELFENANLLKKLQKKHTIYWLNFHIDSINIQDKKNMIKHIIGLREKLTNSDIHIEQIGIGWWFGIKYTRNLLESQHPKEYPQGKRVYWLDTIYELLDTEISPWLSFKKYLIESMTTLHLEPGKLLLDQCGICIHNIIDRKDDKVFIDGNIYSLWSIGQEMAHDPILYHNNTKEHQEYTIYGNLCMEADRIYSRKVQLDKNIHVNDVLVFVNTSTYFSDFSDSQPIKHNERIQIIVR